MFLPVSKQDLKTRNIDTLDYILVTGEAYVDHPSFGHAIVSRLISSLGYSVGIIAQPQTDEDYKKLGVPNIAFLVSSGVIDSMVNNYTVSKEKRKKDVYTPGGKPGKRPDMATVVYSKKLKEIYPDTFVIIGSIEASLRRFAHFDYWSDKVLPSILDMSKADLLMYGMSERSIMELCALIDKGVPISKIKNIRGTMYFEEDFKKIEKLLEKDDVIQIASFKQVIESKESYAKMHMDVLEQQDDVYGKTIIQCSKHGFVVQNPPSKPLNTKELDSIYELPYERTYHPMYEALGGVESIKEVEFSITSSRGCFGACNYCALTYHQGRKVQGRSHESILKEARLLAENKNFKGYIHDVGGPTANFRMSACKKQEKYGVCKDKQCLFPKPCTNLEVDHSDYISLLRQLRKLEGIKKVFIRSGIRFDYVLADKDDKFLMELCKYHVSGQLKVAPEHSQNSVLEKMGKPNFEVYLKFADKFKEANEKLKLKQYLVPYYISSHPGCTLKDACKLAEYLNSIHYMPEQVQDFYPTPGTISTCMYYTGIDPRTMKRIYVPKTKLDKKMQRVLLQYRKKENYEMVKTALVTAGRLDLIGYDDKCLIKPKKQDEYMINKQKRDANLLKKESDKKYKSKMKLKKRSKENRPKNK
ncbi:MAG: YgiQ family radical SAM protein [Clostridia bacterium]